MQTERRGSVFLVGLNRPDEHNAQDQAMVDELELALLEARREPCVLIVHSTTPGIFAPSGTHPIWRWIAGFGTTVPEWNEVGRHAAQQAGFKRVASHVWNNQQYDIFEQTP